MVRVPYWRARSASDITCLISLIPASTAENSMNSAFVIFAMIFARVVLPVPGGPQKMSEPVSSRSICVRSDLPGPIRCSCPTYSSSARGRIRSASGRVGADALWGLGMGWKRLTKSISPRRHGDTEKPKDIVFSVPLCLRGTQSFSLPGCFVQYDASRHARVQRLHLRRVWDRNGLVDVCHQAAGKSGSFTSNNDCQ